MTLEYDIKANVVMLSLVAEILLSMSANAAPAAPALRIIIKK